MLGCSWALAGDPIEVRVLLHESDDPIEIGPPGEPHVVRVGDGGGLVLGDEAPRALWLPKGDGPWRVGDRTVRGRIAVRAEQGRIQVLNRLDLELYVASTVGGEMIASWPREALKAQAVAARTYVLHEAAKRRTAAWDVRSTPR